jgi:benzoate/toluate 1,2-dioxygenase beta subunit
VTGTADAVAAIGTEAITLAEAEAFLFREARYADEHRYHEWESLWTDDAVYWVPANEDDGDPTTTMSIIFDNRARIGTRIKQLHSGKRHAQNPPSHLRRMISNVELLESGGLQALVGANFLIVESRARGTQLWAGRSEHGLRRTPEGLRMSRKKVMLVDLDRALHTLAFLV